MGRSGIDLSGSATIYNQTPNFLDTQEEEEEEQKNESEGDLANCKEHKSASTLIENHITVFDTNPYSIYMRRNCAENI